MCFGPASPDAGVELLRQLFLQWGEGVGVEPNHTVARHLGLYKSFNTLWFRPYKNPSGQSDITGVNETKLSNHKQRPVMTKNVIILIPAFFVQSNKKLLFACAETHIQLNPCLHCSISNLAQC